jgi:hypothetical protein
VLPSVPVIVTWVALVAVTVKVDEFPEVIEVGLAVMPTVSAVSAATVMFIGVYEAPPQWSHSSTTVFSAPAARLSWVFRLLPLTT